MAEYAEGGSSSANLKGPTSSPHSVQKQELVDSSSPEAPSAHAHSVATGGPRLFGSRRANTAINAAAGGMVVAALLAAITWIIDDRREIDSRRMLEEFAWRQTLTVESSFPGAELSGLDLSRLYAPSSDLSGARAVETDFSDSALTSSRLDSSDLRGARFEGASLLRATLVGADLSSSNLTNATLARADMRGALLRDAKLTDASAWRADLRGADLSDAEMSAEFGSYSCWDEDTIWPSGHNPEGMLCDASGGIERQGLLALHYHVDGAVTVLGVTNPSYTDRPVVRPGDRIELVVFARNAGRAQIRNVGILVKQDPTLLWPDSVVLVNGNYPDGYEYPTDAIQADGTQINAGIGHYDGFSDAYLVVQYDVQSDICHHGGADLRAFLVPEDHGAVHYDAQIQVDPENCDP